jgi:ABC-type branched-subunit amino acid transport system substrate-binding protein
MKKTLSFIAILFTAKLFSAALTGYRCDTLRLGLLINSIQSVAAKHGAEMAIQEHNRGGKNFFTIDVRSMQGPWGTGARQAVDLAFNKDVWAIIVSADGRNTHLAEQVSAKTHVIFLNAGSADPTLSRAFVPWYFSFLPDDRQAADILTRQLVRTNRRKVVALADSTYDAGISAESFARVCKANAKIDCRQITIDMNHSNEALNKIKDTAFDCIVIFGTKETSLSMKELIQRADLHKPVYIRITLPAEKSFTERELAVLEGCYLLPGGYVSENSEFTRKFSAIYGYTPGPAAAYAYDAVKFLTDMAKNGGYDRIKVYELISNSDTSNQTRFDKRGNLRESGIIMRVTSGMLVPVER